VRLPAGAERVVAARVQRAVVEGRVAVGDAVEAEGLLRDLAQADALHHAGRAGEIPIHEGRRQADSLEDLGAAIRLVGRDPHLRHDLEEALGDGLDVAGARVVVREPRGEQVTELAQRGEREVRVHGLRPVAGEEREVVHLPGGAGLDHEPRARPQPRADEVLVHVARGEERRNGDLIAPDVAVRQDDDVHSPAPHHVLRVGRELGERGLHPLRAPGGGITHREDHRAEVAFRQLLRAAQLLHVLVREDGLTDLQPHVRPALVEAEDVGPGPDERHEGHHRLLADRVDRGIGHLGEELAEIGIQGLRPIGEDGEGRVVAHGSDGLLPCRGHGRHDEAQVFLRVAEGLLSIEELVAVGHGHVVRHRDVAEAELRAVEPLLVGAVPGEAVLQLLVVDDAPLVEVDEEHLSGLEAPLLADLALRDVEHAGLGGEDHQIVVGEDVAGGAQPVPIEHGPDLPAVGEGHGGGAVPGLHERGVVLVEGAAPLVHEGVVGPGLRDHQHHRVGEGVAAEIEQLQGVVEGGRVRLTVVDERPDLVQAVAQELRGDVLLAGADPVHVAAQGVDLPVVRDEAERVRQIPRGEGVGGEALVHHGQRGLDRFVLQVQVELAHLVSEQHAFVDDRARRERRHVELARPEILSARIAWPARFRMT
jgi:hypothetical protein